MLLASSPLLPAPPPTFRLPDDVSPIEYWIDIRIDPDQPAFEGLARIEVEVKQPVDVIWVNATGLTFQRADLESEGQKQTARVETVSNEFAGLHLDQPISAGRAKLTLRYEGRFSEKPPVGPFRTRVGGAWSVYTTFTPIDARRAFRCFDEPRFKSRWNLTLRVNGENAAFANTPVVRTTEEPGGWKTVQFAATKPLPSELVAFAVGPFERFDGGRAGVARTPVGVITPSGRRTDGAEAARATQDLLPRLERYTDIPYPFEKLDHIGLPEGAFGATENPGLITYRMDTLLPPAGSEISPLTQLRRMRRLMAHELAHQWFGNLVTQSSWEDTWLSEGFATWLAARVMDEDEPAGRRRLSAVQAREQIMAVDESDRALPVRRTLRSRQEMDTVYNRFVYQKGAALLLMLEAWIGDRRFRDRLRTYLRRHRFSIAGTADLASALESATEPDVSRILSGFLNQTGPPSIKVSTTCEPGKSPRLRVEQTGIGKRWILPVCWNAEASGRGCTVVSAPIKEVELNQSSGCPAWIYPNAEGAGYYRTAWDEQELAKLRIRELTASERLTLAYDLRAMKRASRLGQQARKLLSTLSHDVEPEIARAAEEAAGGN